MFEKEVELHSKEWFSKNVDTNTYETPFTERHCYELGFKDGAEFGYNKANEWHYVAKGDLPKVEGEYSVAVRYPKQYREVFVLSYTSDYEDEEKFGWYDSEGTNFDDEVYAWREKSEPPKEIEQ